MSLASSAAGSRLQLTKILECPASRVEGTCHEQSFALGSRLVQSRCRQQFFLFEVTQNFMSIGLGQIHAWVSGRKRSSSWSSEQSTRSFLGRNRSGKVGAG